MFSRIQKIIEKIYKVETFLDVEDYIFEKLPLDAKNSREICKIQSQFSKGCLLIYQNGDDLELAIYLDRETVSNLKGGHLQKDFHRKNLSDFFLATEEISHFIYAVWSIRYRRQITILEMELQAEVDKYITAIFYSGSINDGKIPFRNIKRQLFEDSVLHPCLQSEEIERYKDANRLAMNYCHHLESHYLKKNDIPSMIRDMRHFYRLGQNGKISHINGITFRQPSAC
ncbi:MAG: hypothetical protein HY578_03835 [Nitrospinae bacterium]|nr:hypothetical protein [Nitrospinota bacterium]